LKGLMRVKFKMPKQSSLQLVGVPDFEEKHGYLISITATPTNQGIIGLASVRTDDDTLALINVGDMEFIPLESQ